MSERFQNPDPVTHFMALLEEYTPIKPMKGYHYDFVEALEKKMFILDDSIINILVVLSLVYALLIVR